MDAFPGGGPEARPSRTAIRLGNAPGAAGRLGFILIAADLASESELRAIGPLPDVEIYCTRVPYQSPLTMEHLQAMSECLGPATQEILPQDRLDVIAFGCTSGTLAIGERTVIDAIRKARPGIQVTNPLTALRAAVNALGVQRLSMLAPYVAPVTGAMLDGFRTTGVEFVDALTLGFHDDPEFSSIPGRALVEAAVEADHAGAQALFIACTALLIVQWIDTIEQRLGKPVITSNQAMLWHSLRLAGNRATVPGFGRLLMT